MFAPLTAVAQGAANYPDRPVRLIVSAAAGGGQDIVARTFAARLSNQLGQTFVVDNRGGGGSVGAEIARQSPPTATRWSSERIGGIHPLYKRVHDLIRDFIPLADHAATLRARHHPSVPAKSVQELIAHAKAYPGKLNYSSAGQGGLIHLGNELLNLATGIKTVHAVQGRGPRILTSSPATCR
jgi:tripartite-type tricarboxylate transporter receptor subunit TctC